MRIYSDLASWYSLIDPVADHADEAEVYAAALASAVDGPAETMLEMGAGAGNNAFFLKRQYRCTLADVSEAMLALSRAQNPECEHVRGDMRTLRLGRTFDTVLIHDAIAYMTTGEDVLAAATTAWVHTRPGGAAILAPDYLRDSFREQASLIEGEEGARALRAIEWCWDPDPADQTYAVEYGFLLRDGNNVTMAHDRHVEGLFSEADWRRLLTSAGFLVQTVERPAGPAEADRVFLCRRV